MKTIILGGGLAGLSLAYYLNGKTIILEKETTVGGLCRSFMLNKIAYDIGPHILFSKIKNTLQELISFSNNQKIRRSNWIYHNGKYIKYPFENDLASLAPNERDYCLQEFLNNPYKQFKVNNMTQFFLKTFGEGITNLYLQPYNEKIWKYNPVFMDTQMVERVPVPPKEDILKSANGITTEGHLHQLYFYYPKHGGINQVIQGYLTLIRDKCKIVNSVDLIKITRNNQLWRIETDRGTFISEELINCIPIHEFFKYYETPKRILKVLDQLIYNSIHIIILQVKNDNLGNVFSINFADKNIIFHRVSKLNYLGRNYCLDNGGSTLLIEVTYRKDSAYGESCMSDIQKKAISDLVKLNIINKEDILDSDFKSFKYAYVIYDLYHRKNINTVLKFLSEQDVYCCGRFAEFEYLNTDKVIEHSMNLAKKLNSK